MRHAFVDNLVMIAELDVRPDRSDEFLDYTIPNLAVSRSYPGNIEFDILIDEARPGRIIFYEVWGSAAAQQAYMAWRVQAGDLTRLMSLVAGEPKFNAFRRIADPN